MLPFVRPSGLETARLALRPVKHTDAADLFADYTSNLDIARYLPWRRHHTQSETEAMVRYGEDLAINRSAYLLAITLRTKTDKPIGLLNIGNSEHGISIGFGLARRGWGSGYGSEVVAYITGWLLDQPPVWRVWGYCDEENEASVKVMTRAGMHFEGKLRRFAIHPNLSPEPRNCKLFASVRE